MGTHTAGDRMIKSDMEQKALTPEEKLFSGVLQLNAKVVGLALGLILALGIFVATNWLVIKGGDRVGPHLVLLSQYFIGYRVTFLGSLIGAAYGFALGTICGSLLGWIYNKIATFRQE
jgi:ABC-type dipeptide/oligopeptide/nickel transport system permease subunit